jgi:integration host factor subunit beta
MTKTELIKRVAGEIKLSQKDTRKVIDTLICGVTEALQQGEKVELRGFGSFRLKRRGPRVGRNPKTGDQIYTPSKNILFFRPSKDLKKIINLQ